VAQDTDDKPSTSLTDDELLRKTLEFYAQAEDGLAERLARAEENLRFKRGQQWDPGDLEQMALEGRPAVTINRILPIVLFIVGNHRQNAKDPKVMPEHEGMHSVASVLTHLAMHAMGRCAGEHEFGTCFEMGVSSVVSWLKTDVDYDEDPSGKIVVRAYDGFDVLEDPGATEYDVNTSAKYLIHQYWQDKQKCKLLWPDKAKDIADGGDLDIHTDTARSGFSASLVAELYNDPSSDQDHGTLPLNRYRVREFWWREFEAVHYIVDKATKEIVKLEHRGQLKRAEQMAKYRPERWSTLRRVERALNKTTVVGNVVVEHVRDPLNGPTWFPFDRYAPFHDGKFFTGFIDNLISPQQTENKGRSDALNHLNRTAHSGIVTGHCQEGYDEEIELFGSKPGVHIDKSKCGDYFELLSPHQLSHGHMEVSMLSAEAIKEITGVANMMGYDSQEKESGKALALRQRQGATITEGIFANFDRTARSVYTKVVELIRTGRGDGTPFYQEDEIRRIVGEKELVGPKYVELAASQIPAPQQMPQPDLQLLGAVGPEVQQAAMQQYQQMAQQYQQAMQIHEGNVRKLAEEIFFAELRDLKVGQYSVTVADSPNSPTARAQNGDMLIALADKMPGQIPPEAIIEASDIAGKEKLIESITQQRQMMAQAGQGQ